MGSPAAGRSIKARWRGEFANVLQRGQALLARNNRSGCLSVVSVHPGYSSLVFSITRVGSLRYLLRPELSGGLTDSGDQIARCGRLNTVRWRAAPVEDATFSRGIDANNTDPGILIDD